ncbi:MAG TPA: hypothetical protein PKD72_04770, partial [Gemmatales bacterium]|nr:hypothetical protein [Gemmatales bacterium]
MTCRFSFLHRMSLVLCSLMLLVITLRADPFNPKEAEPKLFKNLRFRNIGPAAGGRICRVAGVPGEGLTYYAATASGGLWKSVDGGLRW